VPGPKPAPPGNYTADIQTDLGTISVQLFPQQAPLAVGNFVGLVEGTQPWRDPRTGKIRSGQPFYRGLTFHRVIPNFMIQGGDPLGTGDPGYTFADETTPALTFDRPGRLAMANAGPNTNGAQFFITVAPYPSLNGHYTIFGQVTAGQNVADAISKVPRDGNDKPLTAVHIVTITIHHEAPGS
jgi:peptidyl-prolyl cis-trans isomerase A (cyclophilin A)